MEIQSTPPAKETTATISPIFTKAVDEVASKKAGGSPILTPSFFEPILTDESKKANLPSWPVKASYDGIPGRDHNFADIIETLTRVRNGEEWPDDYSEPMQRYFKFHYAEFFADEGDQEAAKLREIRTKKAERLRKQNRPSRSKVKKGV